MADHIEHERDGGSVRELNSKESFRNTSHNSAHGPKEKTARKTKKRKVVRT